MNWKVNVIFLFTLVALIVLYLYSFGPLSEKRKGAAANPASVNATGREQVAISSGASPSPSSPSIISSAASPDTSPAAATAEKNKMLFSVYHNKDKKENFYTIKFPTEWQVRLGGKPGSYALTFNGGKGTVELMDVPDNTTLELYVLSREEPRLKKSIPGYQRSEYRKENMHGREAYELVYRSNAIGSETVATYVAGPDEAIVVNFTAAPADFDRARALFTTVVSGFQWESK